MIYAYAYCYPAVVNLGNRVPRFITELFSAFWYRVDGTSMIDLLGGSPLTLSVAPGTRYIPAAYVGTITPPDVAGLKTADVAEILFNAGTPRNLSVSDLIDTDLVRVPVYYRSQSPHDILAIGLLDNTVFCSLTNTQKEAISNYMHLWSFYWKMLLGGELKDNRSLGDSSNVAPVVIHPIADQDVGSGFGTWQIDLANVFTDYNCDTLSYSIVSNTHPERTTASLVGSVLTLTEVGTGLTTVTVRAEDDEGLSVQDAFLFNVIA